MVTFAHFMFQANPNHELSYEEGVAKLTIRETYLSDQGRYAVTARNDAGSGSTSCFLNVQSKLQQLTVSPPHRFIQ